MLDLFLEQRVPFRSDLKMYSSFKIEIYGLTPTAERWLKENCENPKGETADSTFNNTFAVHDRDGKLLSSDGLMMHHVPKSFRTRDGRQVFEKVQRATVNRVTGDIEIWLCLRFASGDTIPESWHDFDVRQRRDADSSSSE
jgi:hypothetical protein